MAAPLVRPPAVAGKFYPGTAPELEALLAKLFAGAERAPEKVLGCVVPHAGYVYSGGVAARTFARVRLPERVLILAPNHTGLGPPLSLWPGGRWKTPLGEVAVDEPLTEALRARAGVAPDTAAHLHEHAAEVMVPFLQREKPGATIAAVVVGTHAPARLEALGRAIAAVLDEVAPEALLLASSDINHYEPHARTLEKDQLAIDRVLALDPAGLLETCEAREISMCGVAPTAAMLWAAKARGATRAVLVDHKTSGDAFGDYARVVGYAGIVVA
jgi:AmmeMemoRadiSam system protein B